jgi:hypothetical protein
MHSPFFIAGFIVLFAGIIVARILGEQALRHLSAEEKVALIDGFARLRMFGLLSLSLILACFVALLFSPHEWRVPGFGVISLAIVILVVSKHIVIRRRLHQLGVSEVYCRKIALAQCLSVLGIVIFFVCVGITMRR